MTAPHFENYEHGYDIAKDYEKSHWYRSVYHFTLNDLLLIYIDKWGTEYKTGQDFFSDQGSVPLPFQIFIPKDRFLGFYAHDYMYQTGTILVKRYGKMIFEGLHVSRDFADALLDDMCLADPEPATETTATIVYRAVRIGGYWCDYGHNPYGEKLRNIELK